MKLRQRMSFIDLCLTFVIVLLVSDCVNCKWCTRITSEKHVFATTEHSQCLQSYKDDCHYFTREKCTFYELVPCFKEFNHTVVLYKVVEECCPGYQLDPARNGTCIVKSDSESMLDKVTNNSNVDPFIKLSPLEEEGNRTRKTVHKTIVLRQNYTVQYYKSEDDLLFGLSQGAYAGIICAFLFLCCVIILISVHAVKRSLRNAAVKANVGMEHEMVEKMLPTHPQT